MLLRNDVFRRLCRARDMLEEVPEDPVSIEDVAREVGISPFHFIRQFEAVFGLTPHQFRIQSRLDAGQASAGDGRPFRDRGLHGGRLLEPGELQRSLHAARRRHALRIPAPASRDGAGARHASPALIPGCFSLMACLPAWRFRSFREAPAASFCQTLVQSFSTERDTMQIKLTSIMVDDQDKALKFYTEVLGFRKKIEIPVGEYRWITVVSPEGPDGARALPRAERQSGRQGVSGGDVRARHPARRLRGRPTSRRSTRG